MGSRIESSGINVLIRPGLSIVMCDRNKLIAVIYNLATKANKFMGDDKQRLITIGCEKEKDNYKFFVEDTGIGIRKKYQENIFKIFNRLQDIDAEGSGVGLSIARKIIVRHRGKVWVERARLTGKWVQGLILRYRSLKSRDSAYSFIINIYSCAACMVICQNSNIKLLL